MEKEAPKPLPEGVRIHKSRWEHKPMGFYSGSNVAEDGQEKTHPPRDERREREEAIVRSTVEFLRSHTTEEEYELVVKAVLDDSPGVIKRIIQERSPK